jgi:hypothetical protein
MPKPQAQAPSGALVPTAESGHFSYDGKLPLLFIPFLKYSFAHTKVDIQILFMFFKDPNKWKEHNSLCAGEHQSPINIDTRKSKTAKFPPFRFHNYAIGLPENLENNGHTGISTTLKSFNS